jgi:hypothetical protein
MALVIGVTCLLGATPASPTSFMGMFGDLQEQFGGIQEQLTDILSGLDESTISETFAFLREKSADGSFESEEGVENAIEEGRSRFGLDVNIDDQYLEKIVELVASLEDMGFSSDKIIESASELYDKYGADFVNHTDELVRDVFRSSFGSLVMNRVGAVFRSIGESLRNFVFDLIF